jgi:hypothetical protein
MRHFLKVSSLQLHCDHVKTLIFLLIWFAAILRKLEEDLILFCGLTLLRIGSNLLILTTLFWFRPLKTLNQSKELILAAEPKDQPLLIPQLLTEHDPETVPSTSMSHKHSPLRRAVKLSNHLLTFPSGRLSKQPCENLRPNAVRLL